MTREEQVDKYKDQVWDSGDVYTLSELDRVGIHFLAGWDARDGGIKNCCSGSLHRIKELEEALISIRAFYQYLNGPVPHIIEKAT